MASTSTSVTVHHGHFDSQSRKSPTLAFLEKYALAIDSLDLSSTPCTSFFAPLAVYHDTSGNIHIGASAIWSYISRQFAPFSQIRHDVVEARVIEEEGGREVVYGETLAHFKLRGDEDEIVVPRFFVWTVGRSGEGEGTDGKVLLEQRLFWDTG
ncbi:hypothetical protein LSUE1_G008050, partial [Lachnellula suecica]